MTLIGYRSNNHPQQVARRGAEWSVDDRATSRGFTYDLAAMLGDGWYDDGDDR